MRQQNRATSRAKLALSLGTAVMVAIAVLAAEANAQTSGEGLPNLPRITSSAGRPCTTIAS
jgi:hypothetical protein